MPEPVFEVRRSRPHVLIQMALATALFGVALANLANLLRTAAVESGPLIASGFFTLIMGFYAWNLLVQYRDRRPQVVVGPAGLHLPSALPDPIPWSHVWNVAPPAGLFSRMRLDIDIEPETYKRMKLGMRFMGENIARRKGLGGGLTIYTMGYEHNAAELSAAIRRFWPPPSPDDDDKD